MLVCCQKREQIIREVEATEKEIIAYGIRFNDFDVVEDTIRKGNTFGNLIEKQNIGQNKISDILETIKDSIKIKNIRVGKTFFLFRTKDSLKTLQYFIFQPERTFYYIVDFRTKIIAQKIILPVTFKTKTIAGKLKGSLAETLKNEGATTALSPKLIGVYKWSIDFFKAKRGDKFAITYTERFINDSIFDGIEDLECSFYEYKGKRIYAFPFVQDSTSGKTEYYDEEGKVLK
ncbi:MAG: hypothetical protein RLZZ312_1989, partial [Bacteroidota bacterium]